MAVGGFCPPGLIGLITAVISWVFAKLLLQDTLAVRRHDYEAASEPLLPKVARCIPVLSSRFVGKCAARVLKRSDCIYN